MTVNTARHLFELLEDGSSCFYWDIYDVPQTVITDGDDHRICVEGSYRWRPANYFCEICWVKWSVKACLGVRYHDETLGEWLRSKIVEPEPEDDSPRAEVVEEVVEADSGVYHNRGPQPINRNNPDNNHNNHVHVRRVDRVDRAAQSPSRFEFLGYVTSGGEINTHQGHNSGQALIDGGTGYERVVHITTPDGYNLAYSLFFDD